MEGEGEPWKILVIAKVAVEGLTVLCQNFGEEWRKCGIFGIIRYNKLAVSALI